MATMWLVKCLPYYIMKVVIQSQQVSIIEKGGHDDMISLGMVVAWIITVLALLVTHWFKWHAEPHYLIRYVIGVLCLNVPFSIWLWTEGYGWDILVALGGCTVCGGLAVSLAYAWDWALNNYCRRKAVEAANDGD